MRDLESNNNGKDSDFCDFLREVLAGRRSIEELLLHPQFTRLIAYCLRLTKNQADAEDLLSEIRLKVWQTLLTHFEPDFSNEFGGFPAWLKKITFNRFLDDWRKRKLEFASERPEDLFRKADPKAD